MSCLASLWWTTSASTSTVSRRASWVLGPRESESSTKVDPLSGYLDLVKSDKVSVLHKDDKSCCYGSVDADGLR